MFPGVSIVPRSFILFFGSNGGFHWAHSHLTKHLGVWLCLCVTGSETWVSRVCARFKARSWRKSSSWLVSFPLAKLLRCYSCFLSPLSSTETQNEKLEGIWQDLPLPVSTACTEAAVRGDSGITWRIWFLDPKHLCILRKCIGRNSWACLICFSWAGVEILWNKAQSYHLSWLDWYWRK